MTNSPIERNRNRPASPPAMSIGRLIGVRRIALCLVVAAFSGVALVRLADFSTLREGATELFRRPDLLAHFLISYSAAFCLRAIAWQRLITIPVSTGGLFSILQTALFTNHLLPVKAGEILRPYLLTKRGVSLSEAASTTVVARVVDFLCLILLALLLLPLKVSGVAASVQILAFPIIFITIALGALAYLRWWSQSIPLPDPIKRIVLLIHDGLRDIGLGRVLQAVTWTLPSWILEAVVLYVAAQAMSVDLSLQAAVTVTSITILFQVFHVTPGGLGIYEASMTGALALHGVPVSEGAAIAILAHGMKFAYSFSIGLCFAIREGFTVLRGSGASA
jgi:uncharacterized membrane protein YbhN (UPF0104 family)